MFGLGVLGIWAHPCSCSGCWDCCYVWLCHHAPPPCTSIGPSQWYNILWPWHSTLWGWLFALVCGVQWGGVWSSNWHSLFFPGTNNTRIVAANHDSITNGSAYLLLWWLLGFFFGYNAICHGVICLDWHWQLCVTHFHQNLLLEGCLFHFDI